MTGPTLVLLLMLPSYPDPSMVMKATKEFQAGLAVRHDATAARLHFAVAAELYDEWCVEWGNCTPTSARNQAHAHFLAGNLPGAILAYHDGLVLYPWDMTLQRELAYCRSLVAYPSETTIEVRNRVSPLDLLTASTIASLLLAVGLFARLTFRPFWGTPLAIIGGLGVVMVTATAWQIHRETARDQEHPFAVVSIEGTVLRAGNAAIYPPRMEKPLPRGVEIRALAERGGWVQVRIGSEVGWVPRNTIVVSLKADFKNL